MKNWIFGIALWGCSLGLCAATEPVPLWDLSKDEFAATSGTVERKDGVVRLDGSNAFAVPNSAFPDPNTFTVEIELKVRGFSGNGEIRLLDKRETDTGFGVSAVLKDGAVNRFPLHVNGRVFQVGWIKPNAENVWKGVLAVRDGLVSLYQSGYARAPYQLAVVPNLNDLWVGAAGEGFAGAADLDVVSLKVYGSDLKYYARGEDFSKFRSAYKTGDGWSVRSCLHPQEGLPNVFYYGDSISLGYSKSFEVSLAGRANCYHQCAFTTDVNGFDARAVREAASVAPMDIIVFNNGLHSLHWREATTSEEKVREVYRGYIKAYREAAPKARIFYAMTTPSTEKAKPPKALGERDVVVCRLNRIAGEVMKEENIPVIDLYTEMLGHMDLAAGDTLHWTPEGYKIISDMILESIGLSGTN